MALDVPTVIVSVYWFIVDVFSKLHCPEQRLFSVVRESRRLSVSGGGGEGDNAGLCGGGFSPGSAPARTSWPRSKLVIACPVFLPQLSLFLFSSASTLSFSHYLPMVLLPSLFCILSFFRCLSALSLCSFFLLLDIVKVRVRNRK